MEYLKEQQYYIDRYDLSTIQECLEMIDVCTKSYVEGKKKGATKGLTSEGEWAKTSNWMTNQLLFQIKGKRYKKKEEAIQKWLLEDQIKQFKYDNTVEPRGIRCPDCKKVMPARIKHLETLDDPIRMMFLFGCLICKKKRWIYEDGKEYESKPILCPKCNTEVEMSTVKEGKNEVIWKTTCRSCGFSKTTVDDFKKSRIDRQKQEENDKKLLETYRNQFCSEEKGKEALEYIESLEVANVVFDEELRKYDSLAYQKVSRLKKLSVLELEKLLTGLLEKEHFIKFSLEQPQIGQHVIVSFNVQDANSSRRQDASIENLQKLIKDILEGTNWRLMTDSISYRLGYLSGRLKGYEREEDLLELSGDKKEEKQSKIDPEMLTKYGSQNIVQLARFLAESKGVEDIRKKRLQHEPEGFFLQEDEGPYTCSICDENHYGNEMWWNLHGLRCVDCWRNIKEGVIPSLPYRYKSDGVYFQNWQITSDSDFNIHPSTARKLRRQGLLLGRDLKRIDGVVYCTVYLNEENKEFLEKYPRKPRQKWILTDLLGKKVEV